MTDKPKDLNIVDLAKKREEKKKEEEKIPDVIVEKLKTICEKAEGGKLRSVVMNFDYEVEDDDDEDDGNSGSMFYNKSHNPLEVLGTVEVMKSQVFHMIFHQDDCDE
jgi:hypothetical protein